jgi:2'-hydroxyisoflavone reductase
MKLLILGGTQFVGRAIAAAALERGHELTLFHRGRTNPGLFPEAEHLHGDRDGDLSALEGRSFEAVIDTSGYVPRVVRASAELLAGSVGHYDFVSTIGVYSDFSTGPGEQAPKQQWDGVSEDVNAAYGALKAACEDVVQDVFGDLALMIRPGLIVGPHDPTYRFTYWVDRIARGGTVVAPEPRENLVQLIDVRDLAEWLVRCAEDRVTGAYNAVGPATLLTMEEMLEACRMATESDAQLRWLSADLLKERGVEEWSTLPLWLVDPGHRGVVEVDNSRALAAGLTLRPLDETIRDTLAWIRSGDQTFVQSSLVERPLPGLDPELEAELVAA